MPSDQTGLVSPGLTLGSDDPPPAGGGGFASWSQGKKIGVIGGGFAVLAILAYVYAKHKSSTATTTTAPEVIAPSPTSTPSGTGTGSGNSVGSGAYSSYSGMTPLANELATIQTELQSLIGAQSPVNNGGVGSSQPWQTDPLQIVNPSNPLANVNPDTTPGAAYVVNPTSTPGANLNIGTTTVGINNPTLQGQVVSSAPAGSAAANDAVAINNSVIQNSASQNLYGTDFANLTPAQQQAAILYAAV